MALFRVVCCLCRGLPPNLPFLRAAAAFLALVIAPRTAAAARWAALWFWGVLIYSLTFFGRFGFDFCVMFIVLFGDGGLSCLYCSTEVLLAAGRFVVFDFAQ